MLRAELALVLVLGGCAPKPVEPKQETKPMTVVERGLAFYGTRVYYEQPVVATEVPEGLKDLTAETCGVCHQAIYEEWSVSTHRRAWLDDAQFQKELAKSRGVGDPSRGDVSWLCVNCHTPVVAQLENLVVRLGNGRISEPEYAGNPTFDRALQLDAVTCATCHVRNGIIYGPFGDTNAPHPTAKDDALRGVGVCIRCHEAERLYTSENLGCFFSTGREWAESSYSKTGQTCQSCHMPEVERTLAAGFGTPIRMTRRHWFGGSLIPKKPEYEAEVAPLREVYGNGLTITLQEVTPELRTLAAQAPALAPEDQAVAVKKSIACDRCRDEIAVVITNDRAGHYMPTGDPERHIDVEVAVRVGRKAVARTWTRIGSRYAWWPEIELLADTRVPPGEQRVLIVPVPSEGEVEVVATKARMYRQAFDYHHLKGQYVRSREFFRKRIRIADLYDSAYPEMGVRTQRLSPGTHRPSTPSTGNTKKIRSQVPVTPR
ncbi:MAG: multiheme c-type cytochrome [Polyangiales bacterium]